MTVVDYLSNLPNDKIECYTQVAPASFCLSLVRTSRKLPILKPELITVIIIWTHGHFYTSPPGVRMVAQS
jgi:hypothetical protein